MLRLFQIIVKKIKNEDNSFQTLNILFLPKI